MSNKYRFDDCKKIEKVNVKYDHEFWKKNEMSMIICSMGSNRISPPSVKKVIFEFMHSFQISMNVFHRKAKKLIF